jgi:hypothetical protein
MQHGEVWRLKAGFSLTMRTLPQRSHSIRRNHDGKAASGSPMASAAVGSGSLS